MNNLIPEFWMVWKENGGEPSHRHATLETAKAEAERLARAFPGSRFFVLYAAESCVKSDIQWATTVEREEAEIPF